MELNRTPETEARLNELARRTRRGTDELLEEAVDHLVSYNEWFERKVRDSQAAVARVKPFATKTSASGSKHGNAGRRSVGD